MPGIFGTNLNNNARIMEQENRIYKSIKSNQWYVELSGIKKFENDKTLYENEKYIVLIDGVILNLLDLKEKYLKNNLGDLVSQMYEQIGNEFFKDFRGNFCGFFQDKIKNKTLIYTNQMGDKPIFYYLNENNIIFGSEIKHIIKCMQIKNMNYNLDEIGAYSLLTYGYMYDNNTLIKEIKRLLPGNYIKIENNKIEEIVYYNISNREIENTQTEEQIMDIIERKFENAVKMQLDKNKEYGYENYAPLSAGLDSRMTNYMIKKLTSSPIYNITYSQTNQLDEIIPKQISSELNNHWIFKNLDNGLALYNIDESLKFTDGIIYYAWPSQLYDYMKFMNTDKMGIVHTGVIGDVIIATFNKDLNKRKYKIGDGAYSKKLVNKLNELIKQKEYDNYEIGMMYNRALNGAVLGYSMTFQYYTEAMSPFMNIEFMEYCLSLPLKYRLFHNIYYKWVKKYHKEAGKYSHNGIKIPEPNSLKLSFKGKKYAINTILTLVWRKIKVKINKNANMNPMQHWYETNEKLKEVMDSYYNDNIGLLENNMQLQQDVANLYNNGKANEKIQVITLLSFMKKFFMQGEINNEI